MVDVSVVAPVYNEEENVPLLCERLDGVLSKCGRSYEIVLVDDGSTDGSWARMVECHRRYRGLRLIRLRRNFGQTAAMSAGFRESTGRVIVTMDADLQNDPEDIPRLLARAESGVDVVSGWRKDRKDKFISRRLPSMLANGLISRITGVHLHDYGCTLKAYRREVVDNLQLYGEMHRFIPALASWVGGSLDELPVRHHARQFGKSKYGISRTVRVVLDLLTVKFLLRYSTHPIQIFGRLGLLFGVPGMLLVLGMVMSHVLYNFCGADWLAGAVETFKRPTWIVTPFMMILFGTQFVSMGLLAEIQIRTYHESQGKPIYVVKERVDPA